MIEGTSFIWLHLPKTGGTSIARLFRQLNLAGVVVDPDETDSKHDALEMRINKSPQGARNQKIFITSRCLPQWLVSDWHHKTISMKLALPFEPVCSGLFYSLRLGGTWVAADYWLRYFQIERCDGAIRLEYLEEDANALIHPLLPDGSPKLSFPRHNTNHYSRHLGDFFSRRDLNRIYANNPLWAAWEHSIYGARTNLTIAERLRGLRRIAQ